MLQGKDMEVENVSVTLELLKMVDVSAEQVEQFQRDGAVVLRNVFDDWVDLIREGIQVNLQSPSQYSEWLKVWFEILKKNWDLTEFMKGILLK